MLEERTSCSWLLVFYERIFLLTFSISTPTRSGLTYQTNEFEKRNLAGMAYLTLAFLLESACL